MSALCKNDNFVIAPGRFKRVRQKKKTSAMKKEPIDYGDEYAPKLHFSAEQIEELQDAGCDDELIKALAYNVGRICEERVYLGLEPTPALTIRRSLDKIEKHARALALELHEGPPEVCRKLANTLYFDKLEIGGKDGYHPFEDFKRALRQGRIVGRRMSPLIHVVTTLTRLKKRLLGRSS